MPLSAPFAEDLQRPSLVMFCATQIEGPDWTMRNLDGAGFATFAVDGTAQTFVGRDSTFGVIGGVTEIVDGIAIEAPTVSLNLLPKTNVAMATLAAPAAQGSRIRIWVGSVNRTTGAVNGEPELWYDGVTNVPTQSVGKNTRILPLTTNSALMEFLRPDEGARMNDGFHQLAWPGERGFQFITNILETDVWGSDAPKSNTTYVQPISERLPANLR
jgi:hypothetical protein